MLSAHGMAHTKGSTKVEFIIVVYISKKQMYSVTWFLLWGIYVGMKVCLK